MQTAASARMIVGAPVSLALQRGRAMWQHRPASPPTARPGHPLHSISENAIALLTTASGPYIGFGRFERTNPAIPGGGDNEQESNG